MAKKPNKWHFNERWGGVGQLKGSVSGKLNCFQAAIVNSSHSK